MPTLKLDARNVRTLPPLDGRRADYTDTIVSGFVLRVSPTGARTFGVRYFLDGRVRRYTIGDAHFLSLADARDEARRVLAKVQIGVDPQGVKVQARNRRWALSFQELAESFMRENEGRLRPNTRRQWAGILEREIKPGLGKLPLEEITRGHVRDVVKNIARERPYMANRTFELVRRIYTWAVSEDRVPASPCVGLRKPGEERPRERTLSSEEIGAVWAALKTERQVADAMRLAFYTGARVSEILGLPWAEIDLSERLWTIAASRSKNRDAHPVPLSSGAVRVLEPLKFAAKTAQHVFPSPRPTVGPMRSIQRGMGRVMERSKVSFQFHDIRRTVATGLAMLGTPDYVIDAVLGHRPPKLKRTYNRYQPIREMRASLESWSEHLHQIASAASGSTAEMAP